MKTCTACRTELPLTSFHRQASSPDGLHCYCKPCKAKWTAGYRERAAKLEAFFKPAEKKCSACGSVKPAAEFGPRKGVKDGLNGKCRPCEAAKMLKWQAENSERVIAKSKAWYEANKERALAQQAKHRAANIEAIRARARVKLASPTYKAKKSKYDKAYRDANRERRNANKRAWCKKNPHRSAAYLQNRRAAERRALVPQDRELLTFVLQEARLLAAARERMFGFKWEVDHVVPIRGKRVWGLHVPWNLQVIPMTVNRRKSNKVVLT